MPRDDILLREKIVRARAKVLSDDLKEFTITFIGRGPKADKESRAEAREMISRILPQCVALECAMITGDFPLDKELFDCIEKLLDRGMGKATQPLANDPTNPLPPQIVVLSDSSRDSVQKLLSGERLMKGAAPSLN